jgi:hypothetical protein
MEAAEFCEATVDGKLVRYERGMVLFRVRPAQDLDQFIELTKFLPKDSEVRLGDDRRLLKLALPEGVCPLEYSRVLAEHPQVLFAAPNYL